MSKQKIPWQFLRFCVVGSLNALIDFFVLNLLLWLYPSTNTEKILIYNSLAVLLASTNSFFCNKYWTFQQRQAITLQEVTRFVVVASATTVMNDALILLLAALFPGVMRSTLIGANTLKLGAIIGTMSISFFGMRLWVFLQRGHAGATEVKNNVLTTSLVTSAVHMSEMPTVKLKAQRMGNDPQIAVSDNMRAQFVEQKMMLSLPITPLPQGNATQFRGQRHGILQRDAVNE